jgi:hypothetical protein
VPSNGGVETQIQQQPEVGYWGYFQVLPEGILYLDIVHSHVNLRLYNPATKQSSLFVPLEHTPPQYQGLSATANGKLILITGERDAGQHITLVEAK